jgi:hypothetical protein
LRWIKTFIQRILLIPQGEQDAQDRKRQDMQDKKENSGYTSIR